MQANESLVIMSLEHVLPHVLWANTLTRGVIVGCIIGRIIGRKLRGDEKGITNIDLLEKRNDKSDSRTKKELLVLEIHGMGDSWSSIMLLPLPRPHQSGDKKIMEVHE